MGNQNIKNRVLESRRKKHKDKEIRDIFDSQNQKIEAQRNLKRSIKPIGGKKTERFYVEENLLSFSPVDNDGIGENANGRFISEDSRVNTSRSNDDQQVSVALSSQKHADISQGDKSSNKVKKSKQKFKLFKKKENLRLVDAPVEVKSAEHSTSQLEKPKQQLNKISTQPKLSKNTKNNVMAAAPIRNDQKHIYPIVKEIKNSYSPVEKTYLPEELELEYSAQNLLSSRGAMEIPSLDDLMEKFAKIGSDGSKDEVAGVQELGGASSSETRRRKSMSDEKMNTMVFEKKQERISQEFDELLAKFMKS